MDFTGDEHMRFAHVLDADELELKAVGLVAASWFWLTAVFLSRMM
ncbi:MAG TPA: hypothetical protein VE153_04720 [Myxococcus sp.]|nr:hypothetical protein [Myxococcus sp.]